MGRNHGGARCIKSFDGGSTLSDANARLSEKFFEDVYRDLYDANRETLSSDSRRKTRRYNKWAYPYYKCCPNTYIQGVEIGEL